MGKLEIVDINLRNEIEADIEAQKMLIHLDKEFVTGIFTLGGLCFFAVCMIIEEMRGKIFKNNTLKEKSSHPPLNLRINYLKALLRSLLNKDVYNSTLTAFYVFNRYLKLLSEATIQLSYKRESRMF